MIIFYAVEPLNLALDPLPHSFVQFLTDSYTDYNNNNARSG